MIASAIHAYQIMKGYDFPVVNINSNLLTKQWKLSRAPTILIIKNGKIQSTTRRFSHASWITRPLSMG